MSAPSMPSATGGTRPAGRFNVPSNPSGTGEEVVGDADFTPWLTRTAPGGPCLGGVPSTPGKVTGGGQIEGDPLFSPLGDLISLPALVPSLSGVDHECDLRLRREVLPARPETSSTTTMSMDVRIKALSFDLLTISSPGTSCPATPGSKHATIHGTATVTQPTGHDAGVPTRSRSTTAASRERTTRSASRQRQLLEAGRAR